MAEAKQRVRPCLSAILREDTMNSDGGAAVDPRGPARPEDRYTMAQLIASLSALHDLLQGTLLAETMQHAFFDQLFYFIGAAVWNDFIQVRYCFSWKLASLCKPCC
jgi:hypothetical protein